MTTAHTRLQRTPARKPLVIGLAAALAVGGLALADASAATAASAPANRAERRPAATALHFMARSRQLPPPRHAAVPDRPAATIVVTHCLDDGSAGSLREAVDTAISGDIVDLGALSCSTITLTQGALVVAVDDLTLQGPTDRELAIDGNGADRVILQTGFGMLGVSDLHIQNGRYEGPGPDEAALGGCIHSAYDLTLDHVTVSGCSVGSTVHQNFAAGGGVFVAGALAMTSSTISDNAVVTDYGTAGGVVALFGGVTISSSTISGNSAPIGAGIYVYYETARIGNSTISGNTATQAGGGIAVAYGTLELDNSTVTSNTAATGGGLAFLNPLSADLQSTILAANIATDGASAGADIDGAGTTLTGANNLVTGSNAALPADTLSADPQLLPLADNGGPTRTHALAATSPAIDAGNNDGLHEFDQRGSGYARTNGIATDIGAFETALPDDTIFENGFES